MRMLHRYQTIACLLGLLTIPIPTLAGQAKPADRALSNPTQDSTKVLDRKATRQSALKELREDLDALVSAPEWSGAHVGVSVVSLESGEPIYRKNDDKFFIPASLQKLFTTSAALEQLGPQHTFSTTLYLDGTLSESGEFVGNVIIRGGADPTWSSSFGRDPLSMLDRWAEVLDSIGVRSIKGTIIGDDDLFDEERYAAGWSWDDFLYAYAPQVSALSIADNAVEIQIIPPRNSDLRPSIRVIPENDYVRVVSALRFVDSTGITDIKPKREEHSTVIDITGTYALTSRSDTISLKLSVDNPTLYFAHLLKAAILRRGIRFRGGVLDIDDWTEPVLYERMKKVAESRSVQLSDIVQTINQTSHNLGAELLLKYLGVTPAMDGSWDRGLDVVRRWLRREGIAGSDLAMVDGSGLSRLNLVTPHQIVTLLTRSQRLPWGGALRNSLAEPGKQGTLRRRMVGTRAEKNVRAKTGSMNNVSALAGFATTRDGEDVAFAITISNFIAPLAMAQNVQDLICMRLSSFSRKN